MCWRIEQTGAPAFGYPAKDQRKLATECRRLKARLRQINFHAEADLKADKVRKARLVHKAPPVSVEKPAHLANKDQLVLKVLRAKLVHRGLPGLLANAAKRDRKARQVRPVRQDLPGRRAIRVRRLRSASLPAPTTRSAQTTRSWFHSCRERRN
jgi:hypothetical protein